MPCARCGPGDKLSTARTGTNERPPRVGSTAPVRYTVGTKTFSTLTAAQDYARQYGGVIRTK